MKQWFKEHWKLTTFITVLFVISGISLYVYTQIQSGKSESNVDYMIRSRMKREDIHFMGEQNQYVLASSSKNLSVAKKYAITSELKIFDSIPGVADSSGTHLQQEGEYYNLILYDLEKEGLPERKIDLFQVVRNYHPNSIPIQFDGLYYLGDTIYYRIRIAMLSEGDSEFKSVYLNLETEKIEELPDGTVFSKNSDVGSTGAGTTVYKVLRTKGYSVYDNIEKGFDENTDPNIRLYDLYPDLKEKLIDQEWVLYARPDKVTPDEWFDTLLHWFASKGEDVLPVYGFNDDWSVSDTQLHNSQEAHEWKEAHPEIKNGLVYKPKTDGSESE